LEPLVDSLVEVSISASGDDVEVSIEVTNVVGIPTDVEDLMELEIVSKKVDEIVDPSNIMIGLLVNVAELCAVVDISEKIDVLISLSSVDENMSSTLSEVLVMALLGLVDIDIVVSMFGTSFVDICNEDLVPVITEGLIDVVNISLLSAVLNDTILLVVCSVVGFILVSKPVLLIGSCSVVTSYVSDATDEIVNRLLEFPAVVAV